MITNKNEATAMAKHISYNCKCTFNSRTCNSNQKQNNKTCQWKCKSIVNAKQVIIGILAHVFVGIASI